ncbi:MAG: DUF4255 domain-containing protein [Saprospiraceae bacterium]|nr:DUF4255 domain-containing protein [Lewinella sp.]
MALLNLSLVTQELMDLIQDALNGVSWPGGANPEVFPEPPALMENPGTGVGIYMYHVAEDPRYKNLPPPGRDQPPIRFTPMGLNLYYHLSAHDGQANDAGQRILNEQRMMGLALKMLRDNPEINVVSDLPAADNNRLRIYLQPIPPSEAVNFWTAGESHIKLSAYYEVSVALLEPEETIIRSGRVLSYGVQTFVEGAPRINSSRNSITVTLPGTTNTQQIDLQPAQVPMSNPFTLSGTGFTGDNVRLLLVHQNWPGPALADPIDWQIQNSGTRLDATAFPTALLLDDNSPLDVLPGVYAAQIRTERSRTLSDGEIRVFEHISNNCPFAIAPRIDAVSIPDPGPAPATIGYFIVDGYQFEAADLELRVYIGPDRYLEGTFNNLNAGEFAVNPGNNGQLQIRLPPDLIGVARLPLRIFVNGIESPPEWIPTA